MASQKNARQLVQATRDLVGVYALDKLGDGFLSDEGVADRKILPQVNRAITQLLQTGLIKCRFYLPAVALTGEYRLDPACGLIEYVKFRGNRLEKTSLAREGRDYTTTDTVTPWGISGAVRASGTPYGWYNDISDMIGLVPVPDVTDDNTVADSIEILAEALADDLVNPTDIPTRIPTQFHEDLAIGAAYWLLVGMIGGTDTDADGPDSTDPGAVSADRLALKLNALSNHWGTPDDMGESGTVFGRIKRFANQRDVSESVHLVPANGGQEGWGNTGRVPGTRYFR